MARFRFRFAAVLDLRKREEDKVRRDMAPLVKDLNAVQERIELYERNVMEFNRHKFAFIQDPKALPSYTRSLEYYRRMIRQGQQERGKIEEKLKVWRERLREKIRRRKAMEVLRDKDLKLFKKHLVKNEQAFLDEIAARQFSY